MLLIVGTGGCGLSDYQSRMDQQRERIQKYDAAQASLGSPLSTPRFLPTWSKDKVYAWPFEFYLRLPNGFNTTPDEKPYFGDFAFFRFPGPDSSLSIFVVAGTMAKASAKQKKDEEAEDDKAFKWTAKNFRRYIPDALEDYHFRAFSEKVVAYEKKGTKEEDVYKLPVTPYPLDAPRPVAYKKTVYVIQGKKQRFEADVYLHTAGSKQVAIVFHHPEKLENADLLARVDLCLGTLDVSHDAATRREKFRKAKGLSP